jgi:hypothetical protein
MPVLAPKEINDLKDVIRTGFRASKEFDEATNIEWPIEKSGDQYWRGIRVKLLAYAYGVGDEGNEDDPEFVTAAESDGERELRHEPPVADPPELDAWTRELGSSDPVLLFSELDDREQHEFFVSCSAFDSDSDTAWAGVVAGLKLDARNVGSAVIASSALGGFSSPTALMNFAIKHAGDAAVDDPEQIGSPQIVVDVSETWRRPADAVHWECLKWTLFNKTTADPWYLALWRVELDSRPGALRRRVAMADTGDSVTGPRELRALLQVQPIELAAVRFLQGESYAQVAAAIGMKEPDVREGIRAFLNQDAIAIKERLTAVALKEVAMLRPFAVRFPEIIEPL